MRSNPSVGDESGLVIHRSAIHGQGLFSRTSRGPDDVIGQLHGMVRPTPNRRSIQIARDKHFYNRYIDYLNHACAPTSYIRVGRDGAVMLVALRPLRGDVDEITINYNYSEYRLANPFTCRCCPNPTLVRGYRYVVLDGAEKTDGFAEHAAPHLRDMAMAEFDVPVSHPHPAP